MQSNYCALPVKLDDFTNVSGGKAWSASYWVYAMTPLMPFMLFFALNKHVVPTNRSTYYLNYHIITATHNVSKENLHRYC